MNLRHLELVVEVGDSAKTFDNDIYIFCLAIVDEQARARINFYIIKLSDVGADEIEALFYGEKAILLAINEDSYNDFVELLAGTIRDRQRASYGER